MEQPIMNPPNPYVGSLRIFPGTLVKVSGRPRVNATRFAINLQTGPSLNPRDDLALHLSPCFTPPRVVRNSLRYGAWGLEEAWGNGSILSPHQAFEIMILAEPDQFRIAINGAHYCEFKHRIPFQEITHLTIDGDVDIERITINSSPQAPSYNHNPQSYQPSAPPTNPQSHHNTVVPPYPTASTGGMPMPGMYPSLGPSQQPSQAGPYPAANVYPAPPGAGPMPTGATYMSGYPSGGPQPHYQQQQPGGQGAYTGHQMPGQAYPPHMGGGPAPTGAGYQQNPGHQPGHSSSNSPFGSLPIGGKALGTLAGLGIGAAVLSAANPLKHVKKIMKPKKMFKHKGGGWGNRSSSSSSNSSISSRSSFSSNSS